MKTICATLVCILLAASVGFADMVFGGELVYEDSGAIDTGLTVLGSSDGWPLLTRIAWRVSDAEPGAPAGFEWYYEYAITVRKYSTSHFTLETSGNFTDGQITDVKVNGASLSDYGVGLQQTNSGSPSQPDDVHGIKFDDLPDGIESGDSVLTVISFFSSRAPKWGDAYLKGGLGNEAFNDGFVGGDANDPLAPPANGSLNAHLLVPDTTPEPGSMALLSLGAATVLLRRRRR